MGRLGPTSTRGSAASGFRLAWLACLGIGAATLLTGLAPTTARAELGEGGSESSLGEFGLPSWIPSIGVGAGIQARDGEGRFDGLIRSSTVDTETQKTSFNCRPAKVVIFNTEFDNPLAGTCDFLDEGEDTVDGASVPLSLQLLGPSLDDLPFGLAVRPLLQAGYAWNFDRRLLASAGSETSDFLGNQPEPDIRVEIEAENQNYWWGGLGFAIQLPLERPAFLKLAAIYHEQETTIFNRLDRGRNLGTPPVASDVTRVETSDDLKTRGIGPSIGFESEIARAGPLSFGVSADFMVTFPVSGGKVSNILQQTALLDQQELTNAPVCPIGEDFTPEELFQDFCYDNVNFETSLKNPFYFGGIQVRISWIGW